MYEVVCFVERGAYRYGEPLERDSAVSWAVLDRADSSFVVIGSEVGCTRWGRVVERGVYRYGESLERDSAVSSALRASVR
ncbi:hypothetical protein C5C59_00700 [Rathayibacter sp. AY1F4]|nr:hypothetical protein C5C26_17545 [Rathayibacter sp. AY2B1]PPG74014.1 hypothetical protein C5C59_00700 [Rathayibacter sp. AY1F4]